eukprot:1586784-Prorocentrum_lima.AAC.1
MMKGSRGCPKTSQALTLLEQARVSGIPSADHCSSKARANGAPVLSEHLKASRGIHGKPRMSEL